jgi:hypothetical protein
VPYHTECWPLRCRRTRTRRPAQVRRPGLLGQLQGHEVGGDDVVAADDALSLEAEDLVEVDAAEGDEGRGGIGGRPGELGVEGGQEALAPITVGGAESRDAGRAQRAAAREAPVLAVEQNAPLGRGRREGLVSRSPPRTSQRDVAVISLLSATGELGVCLRSPRRTW